MSQSALAARSRPEWASWTILVIGVLGASVSAILIRYAEDAHFLAISFLRCVAGSLLLAPFAVPALRRLSKRDMSAPVVAGTFLAIHFATWISSVGLTSVAASVLLVSTTPVFVAVGERLVFRSRVPLWAWIGIAIAMAGTALVSLGSETAGTSLLGNFLALMGGASAAVYTLAGRESLKKMGILPYAAVTYGVAAVLLLAVVAFTGVALSGYGAQTWWAIVGLVVGPQLLGHTMINWALKDIDATTVSISLMAEPIIAILLALALFDEVPALLAYVGGVAILAGIGIVTRARRQPIVVYE